MLTPNTCNPFGAYCFANSFSIGYSSRQGSHQVAQKFTNNAFPRCCSRIFWNPCASIIGGSCGAGDCGAPTVIPAASNIRTPTALRIFIVEPSQSILASSAKVENPTPAKYNLLIRLLAPA